MTDVNNRLKEKAAHKPIDSSTPAEFDPGANLSGSRKPDKLNLSLDSIGVSYRARLEAVRIGDIIGPHPSLSALAGTADSVGRVLRYSDSETAPRSNILLPVTLVRVGSKYQCLSNPADYAALRCIYPPEKNVMAIVVVGFSDAADDKTLQDNADLQVVISITRMVPPDLRTIVRALVGRLPSWARCMLGAGRPSWNGIRHNLRIALRKPAATQNTFENVTNGGYDINAPVEKRNERTTNNEQHNE